MSEFDKEAEREKLREQFEAEREDREVTGRMSELLLQGATMTNKHCDTCGNPIFRYRGEEFCPVCQQQAARQAEQGQQPEQTGGQQPGQTAGEQAAPGQQSPGQGGTPAQQGGGPAQQPDAQPPQSGVQGQQPTAGRPSVPAPEGAGDLGEARASLVRTLTGLAGQAENTADVGRKRELLAAAREAAETLAALDRVNR